MHKDELLQLHGLLCQMKRSLEDLGLESDGFGAYDDLEVSPQHIHKSKTDHKRAVFLLSQGLTDLFLSTNEEQRRKLSERFARMAEGKKLQGGAFSVRAPVAEPERDTNHLPAFAVQALAQA